jgi:hypothetical protein
MGQHRRVGKIVGAIGSAWASRMNDFAHASRALPASDMLHPADSFPTNCLPMPSHTIANVRTCVLAYEASVAAEAASLGTKNGSRRDRSQEKNVRKRDYFDWFDLAVT